MKKLLALLSAGAVTAAIAVPALAATKTVKVKDNAYSKTTVRIKKGGTVKWVWKGSNPHSVTFKKFGSAVQSSGTFKHKFTKKGTYKFHCKVHSFMKGKVVVS